MGAAEVVEAAVDVVLVALEAFLARPLGMEGILGAMGVATLTCQCSELVGLAITMEEEMEVGMVEDAGAVEVRKQCILLRFLKK